MCKYVMTVGESELTTRFISRDGLLVHGRIDGDTEFKTLTSIARAAASAVVLNRELPIDTIAVRDVMTVAGNKV